MTGYRAYQDQPRQSATRQLAPLLVQYPNQTVIDYHAHLPHWTRHVLSQSLQRLKTLGLITGTVVDGPAGRHSRRLMRWTPTDALSEIVETGAPWTPKRVRLQADEDDAWEPRPYINPIRARALGRAA